VHYRDQQYCWKIMHKSETMADLVKMHLIMRCSICMLPSMHCNTCIAKQLRDAG